MLISVLTLKLDGGFWDLSFPSAPLSLRSASGLNTPQQVEVRDWRLRESPVFTSITRFGSLRIVTKNSLIFAPGICATIPRKVTPLEPWGISPLSLNLSLNLPICSPSMGAPLLQQITLRDNGALSHLRKTAQHPTKIGCRAQFPRLELGLPFTTYPELPESAR